MDWLPDQVISIGIEWIFHKVDERFGAVAAWVVTLGLFALLVAGVVMAIKAAI